MFWAKGLTEQCQYQNISPANALAAYELQYLLAFFEKSLSQAHTLPLMKPTCFVVFPYFSHETTDPRQTVNNQKQVGKP